ncbi:MAG TPA: GNAT family N-acetyltransferase [Candidatus Dependentiae bacterium]|nr:GNAT family N-acetyltransferase [Candidatus Dependentiae bacterium]HRQ62692.1 GNAT family N-acetyltransferase [Candidatus Dependentiae bacterium]
MKKNKLSDNSICIRQLCTDYIASYLAQFSPEVQDALHVSSLQMEAMYLYERIVQQQLGNTLFYCVFDTTQDQLIGAVEIRDAQAHRGQLYCWMHHAHWGTGVFKHALALVTQEYFATTGALFLTAYVDIDNKRSYHALKKVGFAHVAKRGRQYEMVLRKQ